MTIGIGLSYRETFKEMILKNLNLIDWLEFYPDNYLENMSGFEEIKEMANLIPMAPHCLHLSIGSKDVNHSYLKSVSQIAAKINAPWLSDHLCFSNESDIELSNLAPLERSEEMIDIVVKNIKNIKNEIRRPFLIENITYLFDIPTSSLSESEFLNRILREADCGLLLDVTNVFINSKNHNFDPYKLLDEIDHERVVEIHIAGGIFSNGTWYDTHSEKIDNGSLDLLSYILKKTPQCSILLERDRKCEHFVDILDDLRIVRSIYENVKK